MSKTLLAAGMVAFSMLLSSTAISAQEMSFRRGTVTGISPIQVAAQATVSSAGQSRVGGALGRMFGRAVGRAVSRATGEYSYEAYDVANGAVQDVATGAGSRAAAQITAYLVTVRFDGGDESAIQSAHAGSLRVGNRVRVLGSGSAAQIVAE